MNKDGTPHGNAVPTEQRFWKFVDKAGPDECWLWNGNRNRRAGETGVRTAHGTIRHNRKTTVASRVSWELHFGIIPESMCVCHKCDVPLCVNPNHLFLGTQKENVADAYKKGRLHIRKGTEVNTNKLTENQVRLIRSSYVKKYGALKELSDIYGVTQTTILNIVTRRIWKHIP